MDFYIPPKFDGVSARAIRQWREYYIDYKTLKRLLLYGESLHGKIISHMPPGARRTASEVELPLPTLVGPKSTVYGSSYVNMEISYIERTISYYPAALQEMACDQAFFEVFCHNVEICNNFFIMESQRIAVEYDAIVDHLREIRQTLKRAAHHKLYVDESRDVWMHVRALCKSIHGEMRDLRSFSRVNFLLTLRLIKMYRKILGLYNATAAHLFHRLHQTHTLTPWVAIIKQAKHLEFTQDLHLNDLCCRLEHFYAHCFTLGHLGLAQKELYVPRYTDWHVFHVGLRLGGVVFMFLWILWETLIKHSQHVNLFNSYVINIYAACGGLILFGWGWAANLCVWEAVGLDYKTLLGYTIPFMTIQEVYLDVSFATMVYFTNIILYYKFLRSWDGVLGMIPVHLLPMLMCVFFVYKMIFPWHQRKAVWYTIFQVVFSPFNEVSLKQTYVGDYLTSFNMVLVDIVLASCYINHYNYHATGVDQQLSTPRGCGRKSVPRLYIGPVLIGLPLFFRLVQCLKVYYVTGERFPSLANGCKYGLALSVVLFGIFNPQYVKSNLQDIHHVFWVMASTATTLYSWTWDVVVDWGLFRKGCRGLRPKLYFYDYIWFYYVAIVLNLGLRFLWTVSLIHYSNEHGGTFIEVQKRLKYFLPAAELFRRSMWSWLRIENAQVVMELNEGVLDVSDAKRREVKNKAKRSHLIALINKHVGEMIAKINVEHGSDSIIAAPQLSSEGLEKGETGESARDMTGNGGPNEDKDYGNAGCDYEHDDHHSQEEEEEREREKRLEQRTVVVEIIVFLGIFVAIDLVIAKAKDL